MEVKFAGNYDINSPAVEIVEIIPDDNNDLPATESANFAHGTQGVVAVGRTEAGSSVLRLPDIETDDPRVKVYVKTSY